MSHLKQFKKQKILSENILTSCKIENGLQHKMPELENHFPKTICQSCKKSTFYYVSNATSKKCNIDHNKIFCLECKSNLSLENKNIFQKCNHSFSPSKTTKNEYNFREIYCFKCNLRVQISTPWICCFKPCDNIYIKKTTFVVLYPFHNISKFTINDNTNLVCGSCLQNENFEYSKKEIYSYFQDCIHEWENLKFPFPYICKKCDLKVYCAK